MRSGYLFKYRVKTKERFKCWLQNINVTTTLEGNRVRWSWAGGLLRNSLFLRGVHRYRFNSGK